MELSVPKEETSVQLPPLTLVLGGARSGKSRHAESLITSSGASRVYLATAEARDDEMIDRIRHHRENRGSGWLTVEEPLDLAGALLRHCRSDRAVLVDCLTLWVSNLLMAERDLPAETARLVDVLPRLQGPVVFVANEVGLGIVPDNPLSRAFRDYAGWLNQAVASCCQRVVFIAAGLPVVLKSTLPSV